jgi:hypothetical protein
MGLVLVLDRHRVHGRRGRRERSLLPVGLIRGAFSPVPVWWRNTV